MMSLPANNNQSLENFMKATLSFDITPDDGVDSTVTSSGEGHWRPIKKRETRTLCSRGFVAVLVAWHRIALKTSLSDCR